MIQTDRTIPPRAVDSSLIAGIDFGMRSPMVMLWARVGEALPDGEAVLTVEREYVACDLVLEDHLRVIDRMKMPRPRWVGVDPAGGARNTHTGISDIDILRRYGYAVRSRRIELAAGIERVRARLDHQTLRIHARCRHLISAMLRYRFDPDRPGRMEPLKDGHDHACDALRYMVGSFDAVRGRLLRGRY